MGINPQTHNVVIFSGYTGQLEEWTQENEKVGQLFGGPTILNPLADATSYQRQIAFDTTGGPSNGRIYIQSSRFKLAVFGPPVPVPDVHNLVAEPTHTGGHVSATVDLAHGPKATSCRVQWAEEPEPKQPIFYFESTPCTPAAPYPEELTPISAEINGLQTEKSYRVRVVVKTLNGTTKSQSVQLRPPAVLSVNTAPATEVTRTTAVLNGSLDADGLPTEYFFQYGIDTNYRNKTATASAGSGASSVPVTPVEISNLQAGRPYHYRLVATNSFGTTYGPDRVFSAASAPVISGLRTSDLTETSATLHARINPGGFDTTYHFEYGATPEYGESIPLNEPSIGDGVEPADLSQTLTNLVLASRTTSGSLPRTNGAARPARTRPSTTSRRPARTNTSGN